MQLVRGYKEASTSVVGYNFNERIYICTSNGLKPNPMPVSRFQTLIIDSKLTPVREVALRI